MLRTALCSAARCWTRCWTPSSSSSWACVVGTRGYADDADGRLPAWPRSPHPTPYDILGMRPDAPYTKRRFYQLVKLYHPDTLHHAASSSAHGLERAVRLERYRLVVAANHILADPTRRRLYDMHGIGWNENAAATLRQADRSWRRRPDNAARNATWEDWERWHAARDPRRRRHEPPYPSNATFAAIVVAMCMVGALAQADRAESEAALLMEETQQRNAAIGRDLLKGSVAAAGMSKDERVGSFLRDRQDPTQSDRTA